MKEKYNTIINLFEGKRIRSIWDKDKEDYYFSVVDIINALAEPKEPRKYWNDLKRKLQNEGSELSEKIGQLKMKSLKDGKMYNTDTLDTEGIFRLIESVPSPKAEPFKMWLASLGKERIDEIFDPEKAIIRAINYYRNKEFSDEWIKKRLIGIVDRFALTDIWKECGIDEPYEYALLTNEIYKTWSGMKANEYKEYKGLRKENLRDNMSNIEIALTDIGEIATHDIAEAKHPVGLKENIDVAKMGGSVAKAARDKYESITEKTAISSKRRNNRKLD